MLGKRDRAMLRAEGWEVIREGPLEIQEFDGWGNRAGFARGMATLLVIGALHVVRRRRREKKKPRRTIDASPNFHTLLRLHST
jgi:hypothetical protein